MKVIEAINEVDATKANTYTIEEKIKWLSRLDLRIYDQIICTHHLNEGESDPEFSGYDDDSREEDLLIGEPYAEMYIRWLEAQIDYHNMEYEAFNNSNAMFESVFSNFRNIYNSTHKPKSRKKNYF